mgnify:CR=1 FL=1
MSFLSMGYVVKIYVAIVVLRRMSEVVIPVLSSMSSEMTMS